MHKVDDALHVSEQLPSLLMLVCLALGGCEQGRGCWDRWQLVEIAAQQLGRHTSPSFLRPHVRSGLEVVAQTSPIRFAQRVSMKQRIVKDSKGF